MHLLSAIALLVVNLLMLESAGHNQQPVDVDTSGLRPNPQTTQPDSGIEITLCI